MRILETEKLLLKPVEEADLSELLDLQWDNEVVRLMIFKPLSYDSQKAWLKTLGKENIAFTVFYKHNHDKEIIGLATLNNIDHKNQRASWGLKLKTNLQGKGLGFEASLILLHYGFYHLNLIKIYGDFLEENINNEKMTNKIGCRKEGLLVKHLYQRGEFRNLVIIGILKEEFYQHNKNILLKLGLLP